MKRPNWFLIFDYWLWVNSKQQTRNNKLSSITLSLLATILSTVGILPTANADELPRNLGMGQEDLGNSGVRSQESEVRSQESGVQEFPANSLSLTLSPSIAPIGVRRQESEPLITEAQKRTRGQENVSAEDFRTPPLARTEKQHLPVQESEPLITEAQKLTRGQENVSAEDFRTPPLARTEKQHLPVQESEPLITEAQKRTRGQENVSAEDFRTPPLARTEKQLTHRQEEKLEEIAKGQGIFALTDNQGRVRLQRSGIELPTASSPALLSQNNAPSPAATPPDALAPGTVRILTPQSGVINTPSTNLVVQYNANDSLQISINQKPLDSSIKTQQNRDETQNTITQAWYNIPLEEGENTLTVQAANGTPTSLKLTVKKTALKIEITPVGDPRVPADGRSTLTISGRITDESGQPTSQDALVTLTSSAGQFFGADEDKDLAGFQVIAREGQFTAQLQSNLEAQKVRIRAAVEPKSVRELERERRRPQPENFSPLSSETLPPSPIEAYTQVEFVTNLRPSLVSGVIDLRIGPSGTNFWGRRRDFLNPDRLHDGTEFNLQGAIFATGKLGEWLFTGAYNSARNLNETCDGITRLFRGPQFCEQQYPVYGDSSTVDYLTPSIDSVYLRFERTSPVPGAEPDYVMWGDYNSNEFARSSQLFTATTRQLHGFKGNYNLGNLQVTAMFSRNLDGFQRDTIQPNGTSGYYFVSRRRLVPGSENVFLETEEANRPGTVISRKPLYRGPDYEIDYDRGTLLFRRPILATEFAFFNEPNIEASTGSTLLVRRIVVTYQYDGAENGDTNLYAGRVQYNFSQAFRQESWIGATYLRQDQGAQDFELYGADFRFALGRDGQVIGEIARSHNDSIFRGNVSGSAYRIEANGRIIPGLTGRAYYRTVEENFANDATVSFTPGQTRYGAAMAYSLGPNTTFRAGYDYEENYGISPLARSNIVDLFNPGVEAPPGSPVNNSLTTYSAGVQHAFGKKAAASVDFVHRDRQDRVDDIFSGSASQLVSRFGYSLTESLTFRAQNELSLGGNDPLYPNRTTVGMDWKALPGVTMRLAHQFFDGGLLGRDSITSLDTIVSHNLWENTTLTGRYSVISAFNGMTGQGAIGLNHRWTISPGLHVNLGYEHTISNTTVATAAGVRFAQPYAVGQSASSLALLGGDVFNVGVEYTDNPDFKASARIEHRTGTGNNNTVFSIAGAGKLTPALTLLGRYEQANFANQLIEGLKDTATLRLGLAYRDPNSDRWNALLRYEYRKNPSTIPDTLLFGSGTGSTEHVFAAEAIYAPSWRWELYGKGAMRYSSTDLAGNFSNSAMIWLGQLRAAYRLNYRMDLAVEGRWIGQDAPSYSETGVAVEMGYYLTPDLRIGLGYSFGGVDDRDFTGYRSKGGVYFGVTFKVNELLGGFGRQKVVPPQQQESRPRPVATEQKPNNQGTSIPEYRTPLSNTEVLQRQGGQESVLFSPNTFTSPPSSFPTAPVPGEVLPLPRPR